MSQTIEITDSNIVGRTILGVIQRLNGDSNLDQGGEASTSDLKAFRVYFNAMQYQQRQYSSRTLVEINLGAIPRNSYIASAVLRLYAKQFGSINYACSGPEMTTVDIAFYKAETKPWTTGANLTNYDGSNPWLVFGMGPNQDYYTAAAIAQKTILKAELTLDKLYEWDMTTFIRECLDRDDMKARMVLKVAEAFELAHMTLTDDNPTNPGKWYEGAPQDDGLFFRGPSYSTVAFRPRLVVTYTKPLAFFASQQDGTIDEGREIFLGAGQMRIGSVVYSPTAISYQDTPAKLWVKNQLANMIMRNVEVLSPPNWATHPDPDDANTGNGPCTDVSTSQTLTIDEQWKVEFTAATAFTVYRDSGTGDDPAQEQVWTQDGTGTTGTQYTSATRGIAFTITAGGVAFVAGDKFTWRTYKDYSIVGASTDSDMLLQICKDSGGSPDGNWYHARTAMTTLTQQVVGSQTLPVALAKYFNPSNKIRIYKRATRTWTSEYTVQTVNRETNVLTINASINADQGDWVHASVLNFGDLNAETSAPFWGRGMSFTDTVKEEKYQHLKARENI